MSNTETHVPREGLALITGATLVWVIASVLVAPPMDAPTVDHLSWLVFTAVIGTIVCFGMTWIVFKVYDL